MPPLFRLRFETIAKRLDIPCVIFGDEVTRLLVVVPRVVPMQPAIAPRQLQRRQTHARTDGGKVLGQSLEAQNPVNGNFSVERNPIDLRAPAMHSRTHFSTPG